MTGLVYIYTLKDKRFPEEIKYVGKTNNLSSRLASHLYKSKIYNYHSSN